MEASRTSDGRFTDLLLTASVTAVTVTLVGVGFPLLYEVRETAGATAAVAWALAAFVGGPLVGAALVRVAGASVTVVVGATVLAAVRLAIGWAHPIPLWLPALGVAAGLVALGALLTRDRRRSDLAVAIVVGFCLDAGVRAAFQTWDPAWRATTPARVVAVSAAIAVLAPTIAALRPRREPTPATGSVRAGMIVGPYLLLQALFLQNLAFQASEAGVGVPVAVVVTFGTDLVALAVLVWLTRIALPRWTVAIAAAATLAGSAGLALTSVVAPSVLVAQTGAAVLLFTAISPASTRAAWRAPVGLALGMLVFVVAAFAYQIDVTAPLPVPRATWPIAVALLLAILGAVRRTPATEPTSWWVVAVPVVAATVALLLWPTYESRPEPVTVDGDRILQWNIHTALDADGQIDPEAIAHTIESSGATVVVLEEVGRGWPIAGQVDELSWLARRLGMHAAWASAGDDQFGNAILTAEPITSIDVLHLPYGDGPQARSALRVELSDGLWVVGAHLEGHTVATRTAQAKTILDRWGAHVPLVLAGDLNMQPGQPDQGLYVAAGLVSAQDALGDPGASTARDPDPTLAVDRVDWIWYAGGGPSATDFEIIGSDASDHLPLLLTVRATPSSG